MVKTKNCHRKIRENGKHGRRNYALPICAFCLIFRFPYPLQDKFSIMLFSPVSWEVIPNTKIDLDEWEHVTCLKNVSLAYEGTRSGLKGYIALGTNYNYSEDITSRGRVSLCKFVLWFNAGLKWLTFEWISIKFTIFWYYENSTSQI